MSDSTKWILMGVLTIVFGIIVLGNTAAASVAVALMAGIMLLLAGGVQIVGGFSIESTWSKIFAWVLGALMILLGWSLLAHPLEGVISLTVALMILVAAGGLTRIIMSFRMRGTNFFWPMLISGLASLLLVWLIWSNAGEAPETLFYILGLLMGIELLFDGFGLLALGFYMRGRDKAAA